MARVGSGKMTRRDGNVFVVYLTYPCAGMEAGLVPDGEA